MFHRTAHGPARRFSCTAFVREVDIHTAGENIMHAVTEFDTGDFRDKRKQAGSTLNVLPLRLEPNASPEMGEECDHSASWLSLKVRMVRKQHSSPVTQQWKVCGQDMGLVERCAGDAPWWHGIIGRKFIQNDESLTKIASGPLTCRTARHQESVQRQVWETTHVLQKSNTGI